MVCDQQKTDLGFTFLYFPKNAEDVVGQQMQLKTNAICIDIGFGGVINSRFKLSVTNLLMLHKSDGR